MRHSLGSDRARWGWARVIGTSLLLWLGLAAAPAYAQVDLRVLVSDAPDPVQVGAQVEYTIDVTNIGASAASGVDASVFYSVALTPVAQATPGWNCTPGSVITCQLLTGTLGVGTPAPLLRLRFQAPATAQGVQVSVSAGSVEVDGNPANNTNIQQSTQVTLGNADLNLTVAGSAPSATVGAPVSFTLNVSNAGPGNAPALQVTGNFSGPFTFSNFSSSPSWSCSQGSGAISCNYIGGSPAGTLPNGVSAAAIVVNGIAGPAAGTATLSATATTSATDPTPATASASISVTGAAGAQVDLSLQKVVIGTQPIPRNVAYTYRLTVASASGSNQTASGIQINDPLPTGVVLQSFSGSGWNCSGNVVCNYASTLSPGQTAVPLDLVVAYTQAVPASGALVTNNASVSAAEPDPVGTNNQASASASLRSNADVAVALTGPTSVIANGSITLDLTAINNGADDASNVTLSATIAAGFSFGTVNGAAGWNCIAASQTISCSRPTLAVGSSSAATFSLIAPGTAGGPFNQTASITSASFDPTNANNSALLGVTVLPQVATLGLTKIDSVDPVVSGASLDYTLTVSNTGNVSQSGFALVDNLPSTMTYQSFSGSGWACSGSNVAGVAVSCNLAGALAPGASSVVRIRVRAEGPGVVTNQAQVQAAGVAANASQDTTIVAAQSLVLNKLARVPAVALGASAFFDISVDNPGQIDAQGLVLLDDLPPGLDAVAASGDGWTCTIAGSRIDCRRTLLARFGRTTVVIETRPRSVGNYTNRAQLTSLGGSSALVASDSVTVFESRTRADLALDKSDSMDPVALGSEFDYQLRVQNLGPDAATSVRVTDPLPAGVTPIAASGAGWNCTLNSTVVCDLATPLANGAATTVALRVRALSAGTLNNSATASAQELDDNPANNTDAEATLVQGAVVVAADLQLSAAGPASARAGDSVELVALARNQGPSVASSVLLRALTDGPWVLESGSGAGFNCVAIATGIECRSSSLAVNSTAEVRLRGRVNANAIANGPLVANLALVSATNDPSPDNNAAKVDIDLQAEPPPPPPQGADLVITKTDSADPVSYGERYSYAITVRNLGPAAASGIVVRDTLPAGLTLVSAAGAGLVCSGTTSISCSAAAPLAAGAQLALTVTVDAGQTRGSVTNQASVSASTSDPVASNNQAQQSTAVVPPEGAEATDLLDPIAAGDTLAGEAVAPVVDLCDGSRGQVASYCDALYRDANAGRDQQVRDALRALYPEEVMSQFTSLNELATGQASNLDARMAELRGGGGGGLSLSGLSMLQGSQSIPFSLLDGLLANDSVEVGGPGDLVSPWGFFVNGSISRGNQQINPVDREVVLDFDSVGVTAGVDYRRSGRWILGGALGYNRFSSQLTDAGSLDTQGFTLTGYNSYSLNDQVYWDTRLSYGRVQLDQTRRLRIGLSGFTLDDSLDSSTNANQFTMATSIGYVWSRGAWTVTPNGFIRYMRSDVDGFAESGSDFAVRYGDQQVSSMVLGGGVLVSRVISLRNGVLTPQFDFTWNRETRNDDTVINAAFVGADAGEFFLLRPDTPDRSYGSFGFGLVYIMANGRQAYLQWRESVGIDGLDRSTINLGARFEF